MNEVNEFNKASILEYEIKEILLYELVENFYSLRVEKKISNLTELALSIGAEGLLQPILIHKDTSSDTYIILDGHQRVEALKILGSSSVLALVYTNINSKQSALLPIATNIHDKSISVLEYSIVLRRLLDTDFFSTTKELAVSLTVPEKWILRTLKSLNFSNDILDIIKNDAYKDILVLKALNNLENKNIKEVYLAIKSLPRRDAVHYIEELVK